MSRLERTDAEANPNEKTVLLPDLTPPATLVDWRRCFPEIVGTSSAVLKVLEVIWRVAKSDSAVLIHGESGTGKELVAKAIHRLSLRNSGQFLGINCSAIPDNLLESELFGHEKGAFTGAGNRHPGVFERATGGSLFLDEIGDMAHPLQAKLLRVLQEKTFTPVGGKELRKANVRIIGATNVDLEKAIQEGLFRADLYYRINVLPIHLPPLRERREDIKPLLEHFLEQANRLHCDQSPGFFDDHVLNMLTDYHWPGNIRQLQNLVERLVVMKGGGRIAVQDLPEEFSERGAKLYTLSSDATAFNKDSDARIAKPQFFTPTMRSAASAAVTYPENYGALPETGINLIEFIEGLENDLITQALERTNQNRNQAAKLLGMNRTTLVERIKKRRLGQLKPPSEEL